MADRKDKPTILAVDDRPELLATILEMLKDDFAVICLTNGEAVLKALESVTPALFILDIMMPQINGYELAKTIRSMSKFANTPIIFLTGRNARSDVMSAMQSGGNDYIVKPVSKELLISKIRCLLG